VSNRCRGIKSLLTVVIVASILTVPALNSMPSGAPGLYLTVAPIGLVGEEVKGAYTAVQVSLTTPDGPMKTVFTGRLVGSTVFIPYGRIKGIVSSWVRENNDTFPAIVVDCWVISEDGGLLASGTGTVTYDPLKLMKVRTMRVHVTVVVTPPKGESLKLMKQYVRSESPEPLTRYEWRRVLYVAPENYTGNACVKLPVLMLYNARNTSTNLGLDFTIVPYGAFGMVTATWYGDGGRADEPGTLRILSGLTFRIAGPSLMISPHHVSVGGAYAPIRPGGVGYAWVMGRAVAEFQREWVCALSPASYAACRPTGRERVIEYVSEVRVYPSGRLMAGVVVGDPQRMRWPVQGFWGELMGLLKHVKFLKVIVPGNMYLSDGRLDPQEVFIINFVFNALRYDYINQEIVTPVGAFLAAILNNTDVKHAWLAPVLTLSSPTIVARDEVCFRLMGAISNEGSNSTVLYVGVAGVDYVFNLGVFKMPVAYFEALPP